MEAIDNLSTVLDSAVLRLGHAARALLWLVAALACAMLAGVLGMTALIVSLWDGQQQSLALLAAGIACAILAALFGVVAARALHAQRAAAAVRPPAPGAPEARPSPAWRPRPLTWMVALLSLLFLGGSRELLALALRFRAVLGLLAHALHVLELFSRRRAARLP